MELVNWSLNAIDRIFSTRSLGSGEPVCPDGTFAAGYTMDSWERWRVVCLAILSVEDIEDVYIFGTMITGYLLIGIGIALVYREIRGSVSAVKISTKLPDMIEGVGRAVSTQTAIMNRNNMENMDRAISAQNVVIDRKMGIILEKLSALRGQRDRFDRFEDQNGQIDGKVQRYFRELEEREREWSREDRAGSRNEDSRRSVWRISSYCVQSGSALRDCVSSYSSSSILELTCSDSVRLVNGTSLCSGRLEVKSEQSWSSVCEADFDQQDAEVVCRELDCGTPSVLQGALYGEVEAPMWTKEFQCGGHESALLDCRRSDSARRTCSPGKAVGLTCSPEPVRLVGGASRCAGTLEVKRGEWRPVTDYDWTLSNSGWTLKEADVICRYLDCGSAVTTGSRNEDSYRYVWWISSYCLQSGSALRDCVSSYSSSSIVELTCSGKSIMMQICVVMSLQASRGQKSDPQENIELDYINLGVSRAEGEPAEEEGAQGAE
ncbi:scavenger receptor cysteine-rich type 1 protein M130-like [Scomber japonicus]|uniref:scavenger receptor cysteine-rich type 1 protein M130-like n=1 Tax=Scomber japonicus TaxID=13676 RepID=UPI002306AD02|nr:scavenger receptor cysteine-rich type 1 protein M130-like [Scomber japonicus]